jgi:hypothetical protein
MVVMKIKVPDWVPGEVGEKDITRMLASEALAKMEYYKSRSSAFERKYKTTFEKFEKKVKSAQKEDTAKWDDLITWEAYHTAYLEWKKKYEEF